MVCRRFAFLFIFFLTLSSHASQPAQHLKVSVGSDTVSVDRATPGGRVMLIGYERTARDYSRVYRRVEREAIANTGGDVLFSIGRSIVPTSYWVAVDVTTSDYGAAAPGEKKLRAAELLPDDLKKDTAGNVARVVARFQQVFMLLVRPSQGAWELTTGDGGPLDADQTMDGKIELEAATLAFRGESGPAIGGFRDGDLVIVFAPRQLGYLAARIKK